MKTTKESYNVKQNNILLGFIISIGMAIIASVSRFMRIDAWEQSSIIGATLYSFIFSMVIWFAHLYLINNRSFCKKIDNPVCRSFISIILVALFGYFVCDRFLLEIIGNIYDIDDLPLIKGRPGVLFARNLFRSIIYYAILFTQKVMEEKKDAEIEIQQLKQAQLEAKISSLKEQLSPHFLFNTLNTLSTLTKEKEAQQFITELANVYRYVLQHKNKEIVLLKQELAFIESYWYILKMRFENSIHLTVNVNEEITNSVLPPLTLQLLVENTVKHNVASLDNPLHVRIYNDGQFLIIENNYQPRKSEMQSSGEGLSNILQQYNLLFGKDIDIKNEEKQFRVSLPIIKEHSSHSV